VVDLALGDMDGLGLIKDLRARHRDIAIVVLSRHEESIYAERALRAGASGYVMKDARLAVVVDALRRVLGGDVFLSDKMQSRVMHRLVSGRSPDAAPLDLLSDRELQVFTMIGQGMGPSDIAARLHLSVKTVGTHMERIKEKLNQDSAAELRRAAIELTQKEAMS